MSTPEAPFDEAAANELGYTLEADADGVAYSKDGEQIGHAEGATPKFHALAYIAELAGQGFAVGYGGTEPITPELILAVSGEVYEPPPGELAGGLE